MGSAGQNLILPFCRRGQVPSLIPGFAQVQVRDYFYIFLEYLFVVYYNNIYGPHHCSGKNLSNGVYTSIIKRKDLLENIHIGK